MDSDSPLPRTPIEWFMFAPALAVLNGIVLLATGHTLFESIAMGVFYGFAMAFGILLLAVGWNAFHDGDDASETDSTE
ncbi:hypothetical protein [Natronorubrum sp. FCH18a]|uniref:hypothetical protein n=1 Tax=Natronorubrum sp. FCH18a TaxID=3447018 RepID=UPI003F519EB5